MEFGAVYNDKDDPGGDGWPLVVIVSLLARPKLSANNRSRGGLERATSQ
jgi:hypothetical protein